MSSPAHTLQLIAPEKMGFPLGQSDRESVNIYALYELA